MHGKAPPKELLAGGDLRYPPSSLWPHDSEPVQLMLLTETARSIQALQEVSKILSGISYFLMCLSILGSAFIGKKSILGG